MVCCEKYAVADDLKQRGARRVLGTMNGEPFDLALHASKQDGFLFLGVSQGRMRAMKVAAGDLVEVELSMDTDPDHVEPGAELEAAMTARITTPPRLNPVTKWAIMPKPKAMNPCSSGATKAYKAYH